MKQRVRPFISSYRKHIILSLSLIPTLIVVTLIGSTLYNIARASFGTWGDTSLIHACVNPRGLPTIVTAGTSCNASETQVTWLKDIDAGTGLSITRSSSGATLSLANTNADGWTTASETWTYASADDPTYTFTISGDKTSKYSPGMRVKLTQTTTKYFIITGVSYISPDTTVTLYGGTDYDLANVAITNPYYSTAKAPQGFPLNPAKWTVRATSDSITTQSSPVVGTYYNVDTNLNLVIPIGAWNYRYFVHVYFSQPGDATVINATSSTANNSESDKDLTSGTESNVAQNKRELLTKEKTLALTQKTTYYLNVLVQYVQSGSVGVVGVGGDRNNRNVVEAVSAYL